MFATIGRLSKSEMDGFRVTAPSCYGATTSDRSSGQIFAAHGLEREGAQWRLSVTGFRAFMVKIHQRFHASKFWRFNLSLSVDVSGRAPRQRDRPMAPAVLGMRCSCFGTVTSKSRGVTMLLRFGLFGLRTFKAIKAQPHPL